LWPSPAQLSSAVYTSGLDQLWRVYIAGVEGSFARSFSEISNVADVSWS